MRYNKYIMGKKRQDDGPGGLDHHPHHPRLGTQPHYKALITLTQGQLTSDGRLRIIWTLGACTALCQG